MPRKRRRNPEDELPYDEWIPAHAVMFGDDGSVSLMTEPSVSNPRRRNRLAGDWWPGSEDRPEIHVYGDGADWTYSMILPIGGNKYYSHHFDKSFRSARAATEHAIEHIGMPGYGGETGTVDNWDDPEIQIHTEGWEPAGMYALGPGKGATRMPNVTMQGYTDEHGFHAIRWSPGYRQSMHGEKGKRYDTHPSAEFKKRERQRLKRARR